MNQITNLAELKTELEKISETVDKAIRNGRICDIERDIILERLRGIYDAIPFVSCGKADDLAAHLDVSREEAEMPVTDEIEIKTTQEVTDTDAESGKETTLYLKEEVQTSMELIERSGLVKPPLAREIIESLYGDCDLPKKEPEKPVKTENVSSKEFTPAHQTVFHETLAENQPRDLASVLSSQTVSQLKNAIGLNDRLMLMSDLFNNDSEKYDSTLAALDECDNIDDAYIYLYEHFTIDDSKEGVKLLISLLESRFS